MENNINNNMSESKSKVAMLVTFEITTRVVVDKSGMAEVLEEDAYNAALSNIKNGDIENLVSIDNMTEVTNDNECPFGTFYEDLSVDLRRSLFSVYEKAAKWLQDENFSENEIVKEAAMVFVSNIEELASIEGRYKGVYDVLKKCADTLVNGVDNNAFESEYVGGYCCELVEDLCGYLGEFFE